MAQASVRQSIGRTFVSLRRSTRILIILLVLEGVRAVGGFAGVDLPGGGPIRFLLVIVGGVWLVSVSLQPMRRVLWRVRNRLLVTYVLVGVVPIVLVAAMVWIVATILMGQITGYLMISSLDRRYENLEGVASNIALATALGDEPRAAAAAALAALRDERPTLDAVVHVDGQPVGSTSETLERMPDWIEPAHGGMLVTETNFILAARSPVDASAGSASVLVYEVLDPGILSQLLPGLATVGIVERPVGARLGPFRNAPGNDVPVPAAENREPVVVTLGSADEVPLPEPAGFWDLPITWVSAVPARRLEDGAEVRMTAVMASRPSLIVAELFSTLDEVAGVLGTALIVIAAVFLCVEGASLFFIGRLTRSITRTVKDTYAATRQVESGNLSHRIPIRADDQLNSLAASFNDMTENVQRLIAEVKDKERQDSELKIARDVQLGLFPKRPPDLGSLEVAGFCRPARSVSGDYYDFVPLGDRQIALVIGDISGKGISAALLMASIQSSLHAQIMMARSSSQAVLSPAAIVGQLNKQLHETTTAERFATFYCSVYDGDTHELRYTNAGHVPPVLVRNGAVTRLEPNGTIIGAFPDVRYEENRITLDPGDLIVAATDGVTECENARGEQFGPDRMDALLVMNSTKPLEELTEIIVQTVTEWAYDLPGQDDTTLLLARRLPFRAA